MATSSIKEMKQSLLCMYLETRGPRILRKYITDKLFTFQLWKHEDAIREKLDADMALLVFPRGMSLSSLEELDDVVIPDIFQLVFTSSGKKAQEESIQNLRTLIQKELEGPIFQRFIKSRKHQFHRKPSESRLLSTMQLAKLYPVDGDIIMELLGITELCVILFEGFGFRPITDFNRLPHETVISKADDILRIKMCRNILSDTNDNEMTDEDFTAYWECLTGVFERLTGNTAFRRESDRLISLRLPDDKIQKYKAVIDIWRQEDRCDMRESVDKKEDADADSESDTNEMEILLEQNEKQVSLKKSNSRRRQVHNKNSRRSFPLSVHGYDKFKKVCNIMQENGIKFTLPSSSSIDTNPSENSAGQQSKGSLELGVAEAGNTTNLPLNLRRSKSLPGRRDTQGGTSIWKVNDTINSNIISIATNTNQMVEKTNQRVSDWISSSVDAEPDLETVDGKENHTSESPPHEKSSRNLENELYMEDSADPTGYFLSLKRRDTYKQVGSRTNGDDRYDPPILHDKQINRKLTYTQPSILRNTNGRDYEEEARSLSATSGEYVLDHTDDAGRAENLSTLHSSLDRKVVCSSSRSGMPSEDCTGYSTAMVAPSSSVEGNASTDTLLFSPSSLPLQLETASIYHRMTGRLVEFSDDNGGHCLCSERPPINASPRSADDGYSSNGYISSVEKLDDGVPRHTYDDHHIQTNHDCVTKRSQELFSDISKVESEITDTRQGTTKHGKLLDVSKPRTLKRFSLGDCLRNCIFCGVRRPSKDHTDCKGETAQANICLLSSPYAQENASPSDKFDLIKYRIVDHKIRNRKPVITEETREVFV